MFDKPHNNFAYKERTHSLFVPCFCLHFLRFAIKFADVFSCTIIYLIFAESELFRTFVGKTSELRTLCQVVKSISFFIRKTGYLFCLIIDKKINLVRIKGLCQSPCKLKVPLTLGYQTI